MNDDNIPDIKKRLNKINNLISESNINYLNPLKDLNENVDTIVYHSKNEKSNNDDDNDTRSVLGKQEFNFKKVISQMGAMLSYVKSGGYGHTFKGIVKDKNGKEKYSFAVKMVAYSKKDDYGDEYNLQRPENAELCMLKVLSYFVLKKMSPHIILPISTFYTDIKPFLTLQEKGIIDKNNTNYKEFIERYKSGKYYDNVSIIISEWADEGDLSMFLKKNYKKLNLMHWKCIFFQIISTLAVIQSKYPTFRHNDLKLNNVLISKSSLKARQFNINKKTYVIPSIGYMVYLWDFDFSCIQGVVENLKVHQKFFNKLNITSKQNRYYDLHYFFGTLIRKGFLPDLLTENCIHQDVKDFINYVIPIEYRPYPNKRKINPKVNEKCRLQVNDELRTPFELLENDFFKVFRKK